MCTIDVKGNADLRKGEEGEGQARCCYYVAQLVVEARIWCSATCCLRWDHQGILRLRIAAGAIRGNASSSKIEEILQDTLQVISASLLEKLLFVQCLRVLDVLLMWVNLEFALTPRCGPPRVRFSYRPSLNFLETLWSFKLYISSVTNMSSPEAEGVSEHDPLEGLEVLLTHLESLTTAFT